MDRIKARCAKYNKWFALEVEEADGAQRVANFVDLTEAQANGLSTGVPGTSFSVSSSLRCCTRCGTRKVGTCSHIEELGRCGAAYSYQCLFCSQLKIHRGKASSRFSEWAGTNLIPGAETDEYGNAKGSQYDLAKDGSYEGFKVAILCLYTGEGILEGIRQPIRAMEKKGFTVELRTEAEPAELERMLADACQLWIVSDERQHLNDRHLSVIRRFYQSGHGLYLFGDNAPFYADANYVGGLLLGVSMFGNAPGDVVIGVQARPGEPGIVQGHPVSTGIVNLYEGITIAEVRTNGSVRPLVISSGGQAVTGVLEEGGRRALIDGGFTRLYYKWDTAGTDRFIVNAAAWLANEENVGNEASFT